MMATRSRCRPWSKSADLIANSPVLETSMLGVLSRASRIATNVYEVLQAAAGKISAVFLGAF